MYYVHRLFSHLEKSQYSKRQRWALEEITGCLLTLELATLQFVKNRR